MQIDLDEEVPPGEYAIVIRPTSKDVNFSGTDIARNQGEGLLFNSAWGLSVINSNAQPVAKAQ